MAAAKRTHHTYRIKKSGKTVHSGITKNPKRRKAEHKRRFGSVKMEIIGSKKTESAARKWESKKPTSITPRRKPARKTRTTRRTT